MTLNDFLWNISPNPASINFKVEWKNMISVEQNFSFTLFDLKGKEIVHEKLNESPFIFNTTNIVPGIYFYSIREKSKTLSSGKLVIK